MLAFLFTLTVIVLLVGGSIWIMYNLAGRTMIDQGRPPSTGEMM